MSGFIACIQAIENRAHAQSCMATLKVNHPSAAQIGGALLAGSQSATNDYGEPIGATARPRSEALGNHKRQGVMASVILLRWRQTRCGRIGEG